MTDLSNLTGKELMQLIADAQALREERRAPRIQQLRDKWLQEAKDEGYSVHEVLGIIEPDFKRAKARRDGTRAPARVKYRNPDDPSQTWTGKGRMPTWMFQALQATGKAKQDFLIHTASKEG